MIAPLPSSKTADKPSIAIVGAGPGGLAAGMLLARAGADVTIHEAQPVIGGRTRRTEVGDFAFDTGPTFFMMPWVLEEIFSACGKRLARRVCQETRLL